MDDVQAPIVPIVGDLIRQVPGTISLGQGVVHYGPPRAAIDAARAAAERPATHQYHDGHGLPALVERLAHKLRTENGADVDVGRRLMVTAGANLAFMHAAIAVTEPGDEIILPAPFYFNHEMAIQMAGCRAVPVPTDERYQLRIDAIRGALTDRTRAIVTISPNNPSGAVFSEASLREVNALCRDRGMYHIADEVYEYFTYGDARHVSPGSFAGAEGHTISLYSLSKAYGFAGWRVGYMVYPEHLESAMLKSQDTILICPPVISQEAACAAIEVGRRVLRAVRARARRDARCRARRAARAGAARPRPARRRRVLLPVERADRHRPAGAHRAVDPRAPGRGHARNGVRPDHRLLPPGGVRGAAEGNGQGRDRPAGHRPARDSGV